MLIQSINGSSAINSNLKVLDAKVHNVYFQKGYAKLLLKGVDGYLFINDRFERTLNTNNRIVSILADKDIKIKIANHELSFVTLIDIDAHMLYELNYKLIKQPVKISEEQERKLTKKSKIKIKETIVIGNLEWQDQTVLSSSYQKEAISYCRSLNLANHTDWRVPGVNELSIVYQYKERFRRKFNQKFYWSSTGTRGKYIYWKYAYAMNFKNGLLAAKIIDFTELSVRCVRNLDNNK